MTKRMLIDAAHPEETRVVIVDGNRVEELDFESRNKRQLRGNVYLARVTRVEPSLQAAFIEYGGNRHGFLAFSEIHPDYYQIPFEDRVKLIEAEEAETKAAEEEDEKRKAAKTKQKAKSASEDDDEESDEDANDSDLSDEDDVEDRDENVDPDDDDASDEQDAEVAQEQANVASKRRRQQSRRRYKIQEVIKRGQILLVQAVKEERGNKGAAMTTYLSLAGRYCVLMPNTPRGGGISRKIGTGADRKRLKTIMNDLKVPQGMGVIVRTAGAKRTKAEIKRDFDYLSRLWSEIRETTLNSVAPALIHEEGNLVKRSIRDLYNKEIEEVLVQGEDAYKTAKAFIKMLMPSHAKFVKAYDDPIPLYLRYSVEQQIENSLDATVQLKSGGYLVIHPTEALVSVDVNSGRSTKERNVERTALKTNLEAAEEVARQMRLRDLAGLIVIDFIDMDENKNNRAVERKMKEVLARDRARIQSSRISQFGLMEISRQRRRRSLLEGSTTQCPHCLGVGRKRTVESAALATIRAVEEFAVRGKAKRIRVKTAPDVALYLLNEKRDLLNEVDSSADVFTAVVGDEALIRPAFEIEVIEPRQDDRADPLVEIEKAFRKERDEARRKPKAKSRDRDEDEAEDQTSDSKSESDDEESSKPKRRNRRGRRGGRGRRNRENTSETNAETSEDQSEIETPDGLEVIEPEDTPKPKRSRSRSRRKAQSRDKTEDTSEPVEDSVTEEVKPARAKRPGRRKAPGRKSEAEAETVDAKADKPKRRRAAPKKAVEAEVSEDAKPAKAKRTRKAPARKSADADTPATEDKPKRTRKAPAKKAASKKAPAKAELASEDEAPKPKSRTRKAPTKKAAPAKAKAESADTDTPKAKRTRKAPAKKAAATDAEVEAPKAKRTRKAPANKAVSEAETTEAKPKAARKKAPAKKPTKAAPAKAKEVTATEEVAEKPKRTRKAPARRPAPKRAEPKSEDAPAPKSDPEPVAEQAAAKPKKKGWWNRLTSGE